MNKVYACIDSRASNAGVIDGGVWSAGRLDAPLELLHVLERAQSAAPVGDYSGAIGLGAQDALLKQLSALDEQRGQLAQEAGRRLLAAARARAAAAGATRVDGRLRHGELVDTVVEMEPDARLFLLGTHHHAASTAKLHLDHHVERVIRSVKRPVLVVPGDGFAEPRRVVIAFDGSPTARKAVATVAASPLLARLPVLVAMAGADAAPARGQLEEARQSLLAAGFDAQSRLLPGEAQEVLPALLAQPGAPLLVIGAYGHSRIRQLLVGSTTTTLLRLSEAPVLVLR